MVTKWEYLVVSLDGDAVKSIDGEEAPYDLIENEHPSADYTMTHQKRYSLRWLDFLSNMGNAGFELIGEHGGAMIFKRPVN